MHSQNVEKCGAGRGGYNTPIINTAPKVPLHVFVVTLLEYSNQLPDRGP